MRRHMLRATFQRDRCGTLRSGAAPRRRCIRGAPSRRRRRAGKRRAAAVCSASRSAIAMISIRGCAILAAGTGFLGVAAVEEKRRRAGKWATPHVRLDAIAPAVDAAAFDARASAAAAAAAAASAAAAAAAAAAAVVTATSASTSGASQLGACTWHACQGASKCAPFGNNERHGRTHSHSAACSHAPRGVRGA
eukprot:362897-Chlamydomonas_euryale.AAC.5